VAEGSNSGAGNAGLLTQCMRHLVLEGNDTDTDTQKDTDTDTDIYSRSRLMAEWCEELLWGGYC